MHRIPTVREREKILQKLLEMSRRRDRVYGVWEPNQIGIPIAEFAGAPRTTYSWRELGELTGVTKKQKATPAPVIRMRKRA